MELNIETQKQTFLEICRASIQREGIEDLLSWLSKSDFFTAPASTKYHGAYAGGLCQHSIDVYQQAKRLVFMMPTPPSEESLVISTLFHDLCKVNMYKTDKRNQKINGEWREVPYYVVEEKFHFGGHGSKSVFLVQQFMKLTTEEAAAINCHMGFSDGSSSTVRDVSNAYHQFPLAWLVHVADEAATFLMER
ncbi:MAG: HD domain-containing protein [Clostridia bacterium]|nr:HD domain-containing protein [Clostridia bacterium]